jgi:hypothetical protein
MEERRQTMGTFETIAVVAAVYAVVFLAHRASRAVVDPEGRPEGE